VVRRETMSEEGKSEGALQGEQAQIAELAAELAQAKAAADRRWRVTALVYGILCLVIAGYLGWLYFNFFKPFVRSEFIVDRAATEIETKLPDYKDELAKLLADKAPELIDQLDPKIEELKIKYIDNTDEIARQLEAKIEDLPGYIKPKLDSLKAKVPELMKKLEEKLVAKAPSYADELRDKVLDMLPGAKDWALGLVKGKLEASKGDIAEVLDKAIRQLVEQHKQDIIDLEGDELAISLQADMEEAAGPILDKVSARLEGHIESITEDLEELLAKQAAGTLTEEDELTLRYVQLWKTYWKVAMARGVEADLP